MMPSRFTTLLILPLLVMTLSSCTTTRPRFFNDSETLISNNAGVGACPGSQYEYVMMSVGKFRQLTSLIPEAGKCFKITYQDCQ